jgi:hypothetical protein
MIMCLRRDFGMGRHEAKEVATYFRLFLENRVAAGEEVDFGFVKIVPKSNKPRMFRSNFDGRRYFVGECKRWRITFSKKWLHLTTPFWSVG